MYILSTIQFRRTSYSANAVRRKFRNYRKHQSLTHSNASSCLTEQVSIGVKTWACIADITG